MISNSGLQPTGRANTDMLETCRLLLYCGGGGGGVCVEPSGATGVVLPYRVQKFITLNRKIIFQNKEFFGVRFYEDAGPDGFCSYSIGVEKPFWMGLAADPNLDIETTAKAGVQLSGPLPYDVEFPRDKCPQPDDPAWENIIYVYVWWGSPGLILEGGQFVGPIPTTNSFDLVKHDKDSKI